MKLYEYMVIYTFSNGTGRIQIRASEPIRSYEEKENEKM